MGESDRGGEGIAQGSPALFLLSFRQRDELQTLFAQAGWRVVAARRADGARSRFAASGAAVAVVDARGALDEGLGATALLADAVAAVGGALVALLSKNDVGRLDGFFDAGATQFVVSPVGAGELVQAARFALKQAQRLGSDVRQGPGGGETLAGSLRKGFAVGHLPDAGADGRGGRHAGDEAAPVFVDLARRNVGRQDDPALAGLLDEHGATSRRQ